MLITTKKYALNIFHVHEVLSLEENHQSKSVYVEACPVGTCDRALTAHLPWKITQKLAAYIKDDGRFTLIEMLLLK